MTNSPTIRLTAPEDLPGLMQLYPAAFPDEDLRPLVTDLLKDDTVLSLVATFEDQIAGHVLFTPGHLAPAGNHAALLGPLAVAPPRQNQGLGRALVEAGMETLHKRGVSCVCVLGDPAYYSRLGFAPEAAIKPPYVLPNKWLGAWQSRYLEHSTPASGTLSLPSAWMHPALWAP